ncbi:MAG: hypothetical protein ABJJ69_09020 [Paracoccaceae bacterium]
MIKKVVLILLALLLLPVFFIGYFFLDFGIIQPLTHSGKTKKGERINETEFSDGSVEIHQLAFWVEIEGKHTKVWSEFACARKFRTERRTLKSYGFSGFKYYGLNDAEVRFGISKDLDFVAKANSRSICDLVANWERNLPIVLETYEYDVSIEPAAQSCDRYVRLLQKNAFSSNFGPLKVLSTRRVPMNEVYSREAYAPDAVDASLSKDSASPVPDIKKHIETLDKNRCN